MFVGALAILLQYLPQSNANSRVKQIHSLLGRFENVEVQTLYTSTTACCMQCFPLNINGILRKEADTTSKGIFRKEVTVTP